MKDSVLSQGGLNLAFYRALLPESAFQASDPFPMPGMVLAWWGWPEGVPLKIQPGDRLYLFPTPWGPQFERVIKAASEEGVCAT